MNRRTFIKTTAGSSAWLINQAAWAADPGKTGSANEELLAQAKKRIAQHRQGPGVVSVRGADGKAIAGAAVMVEQVRHDFLFGCNCFRFGRISDPRRGAPRVTPAQSRTLAFTVLLRTRTRPDHEYTDRAGDWRRQNGIAAAILGGLPTRAGCPDLRNPRAVNARVRDIVAASRGIDRDVVNEPTHLGRFKTRTENGDLDGACPRGGTPKIARAATRSRRCWSTIIAPTRPFSKS